MPSAAIVAHVLLHRRTAQHAKRRPMPSWRQPGRRTASGCSRPGGVGRRCVVRHRAHPTHARDPEATRRNRAAREHGRIGPTGVGGALQRGPSRGAACADLAGLRLVAGPVPLCSSRLLSPPPLPSLPSPPRRCILHSPPSSSGHERLLHPLTGTRCLRVRSCTVTGEDDVHGPDCGVVGSDPGDSGAFTLHSLPSSSPLL